MTHHCAWCRTTLPDRAHPIAGEWRCALCALLLNDAENAGHSQAVRVALAQAHLLPPAAIRAIGWHVLREATP